MKCSLGISNFLEEILAFPILLFSTISLHWPLKKAFLSLLAILWNSSFRCLYLSFSPWLFASLLFTAICNASPDSHFAVSVSLIGFKKHRCWAPTPSFWVDRFGGNLRTYILNKCLGDANAAVPRTTPWAYQCLIYSVFVYCIPWT